MNTCIRAFVRAGVPACPRARVPARVPACLRAFPHACETGAGDAVYDGDRRTDRSRAAQGADEGLRINLMVIPIS